MLRAGCVRSVNNRGVSNLHAKRATELARVLLWSRRATLTERTKTMTTLSQALSTQCRNALLATGLHRPVTPTGAMSAEREGPCSFLLGGPPKRWPTRAPSSRNVAQLRVVGQPKAAEQDPLDRIPRQRPGGRCIPAGPPPGATIHKRCLDS